MSNDLNEEKEEEEIKMMEKLHSSQSLADRKALSYHRIKTFSYEYIDRD